jgi:lysozyme
MFVGNTASAVPTHPRKKPFSEVRPMTEAVTVFRRDLEKFEKRVDKAVTVPLQQHEFDALVSFDFNTGGVQRASLTSALNAGRRDLAAARFMNWVKPESLRGRRQDEQTLFRTGHYSSGGKAPVIPTDGKGHPQYGQRKVIDVMPAIDSIVSARASSAAAEKAKKVTVTTGTGGAAIGTGSTQTPTMPDLPADGASLRIFLVLAAIGLLTFAIVFAVRWLRARAATRKHDDEAAAQLALAHAEASPAEEDAPRDRPEPGADGNKVTGNAVGPGSIFSRPECVFHYCPNPGLCQVKCLTPRAEPEEE